MRQAPPSLSPPFNLPAGQLLDTSQPAIEQALAALREAVDPEVYCAGRCHELALALQHLLGDGDLIVLLRHEKEAHQDEPFSTTYSHMVLEHDLETYDIHGCGAVDNWTQMWSAEPDKWGMRTEFEEVVVPPHEVADFLARYKVNLNPEGLLDTLAHLKTAFEHLPSPPLGPSF